MFNTGEDLIIDTVGVDKVFDAGVWELLVLGAGEHTGQVQEEKKGPHAQLLQPVTEVGNQPMAMQLVIMWWNSSSGKAFLGTEKLFEMSVGLVRLSPVQVCKCTSVKF